MSEENKLVAAAMQVDIKLSVYDVHQLLTELERAMCVVNRDREGLFNLYETIASQATNKRVVVNRESYMPTKPTPLPKPDPDLRAKPAVLDPIGNWFSRLFGYRP